MSSSSALFIVHSISGIRGVPILAAFIAAHNHMETCENAELFTKFFTYTAVLLIILSLAQTAFKIFSNPFFLQTLYIVIVIISTILAGFLLRNPGRSCTPNYDAYYSLACAFFVYGFSVLISSIIVVVIFLARGRE
jgi:hypothetical protein